MKLLHWLLVANLLVGIAILVIVANGLGRPSAPDGVELVGSPASPLDRGPTAAEGLATEAEARVPTARTAPIPSREAGPTDVERADAEVALPDPITDTQAYLEQKLRQPTEFESTGSMTVDKLLSKPPYNEERASLRESDLRELEGILARHEDAIVAITAEVMRETDEAFDRSVQSRQFAVREAQPNVKSRSVDIVSDMKSRLGAEDQDFHWKYISVGGRANILLYVTRRSEPLLFQLLDRGKQLNLARQLDVHRFFERLPR